MRFTILDLWLTLRDRTPRPGGVLVPQDDLADATPYERLVDRVPLVLDWRQTPRTGRGVAHGTRPIENVTGLGWHQTAATWVDARRCLNVPAHAVVLRDGVWLDGEPLPDGAVVLLHPLRAYVYHGHALNRWTIGVEIMAREPGIEGDARTFWRSRRERKAGLGMAELAAPASAAQLASANALGDYYAAEVAAQGGRLVASVDHRNGHRSRVSDPGQRIHRAVTRPVGERHGLDVGVPVVGSGKPNPTIWSGPPGVRYSWRVRGY